MRQQNSLTAVIPYAILVIIGSITLFLCFDFLKVEDDISKELAHVIRIIEALSAAAISIALPGAVEIINTQSNLRTSPNIRASGALAVFAIVYLFDPICLSNV